jgi:catechol 2,3-dioxygenase-like lactoylglutathione lyase family enzyme
MSSRPSHPLDMSLEVLVIPVGDVDRAVRFYSALGWRLDADIVKEETYRLVQFTPPGSGCSIHFGKGITPATPGSGGANYLVVSDIETAWQDLVVRGVNVSEVFHRSPGGEYLRGPHPQRQSYSSFVSFNDPDGNAWIVQEVTLRLPGRVAAEHICTPLAT